MKFTEAQLEQAFVDLLCEQDIPHVLGTTISRDLEEVLIEKDLKAFEILGIPASNSWHKIREKFKKLVKKFHPDMNSGNKNFEEKLKVITLAYTQLKRTLKK